MFLFHWSFLTNQQTARIEVTSSQNFNSKIGISGTIAGWVWWTPIFMNPVDTKPLEKKF